MKILVECRYDFYNNRIKYSKVHSVTDETSEFYFCKDIGESYKKVNENLPKMNIGNCWCELVVWKTCEIDDNVVSYSSEILNNELRSVLVDCLKKRIEEIEYI